MRGLGDKGRLLASVLMLPLAAAWAITAAPARATAEIPAAAENTLPMPNPANLPPPSAGDLTSPAGDNAEQTGTTSSTPAPSATPGDAPTSNSASAPASGPAATEATTGSEPAPAAAAPTQSATAPDTDATPADVASPTESASVTPAEEPPPDPLASLDPPDRPIAEKMRDLLATADRLFANRKERQVVEAFYQARNLGPLWIEKGKQNARATAAIARITSASSDGLEPKDYRIPDLSTTEPDALAEAELRLTATVITFARHLQAGRFPYQRIGRDILLPQEPPDPSAVLTKIADATDATEALDGFSPPQPGYKALKAKLAELRGSNRDADKKFVRIPDGPLLRPGMEDARVPLLRQRLKLDGDGPRYDEPLVAAIKEFQRTAGLNADGVIGPATVRRLNGDAPPQRADVIGIVIANMERWRWLPRDLGKAHVMLNIPDYTLRVMNDGKPIWQTRVVVGKPSTATPILTETMKFITVNPTWNVPPSIVQNEYLPALAQDPTVLARMGLKVVNNRDGSVHIYQPPGDNNALGRLRFNFPNRFLVYQHDTPDKHLFKHDKRAYSHGCMRVQDPLKYAEVLLSIVRPGEGYTQERLRRLYGPSEHNIQFPRTIPVHITYQTAFVDDAGQLQVRSDIYGIDSRTSAAIRGERAMVVSARERPAVASTGGQVKRARAPQQPRTVSFFEALFGGGSSDAPQRPQRRVR
jgi:murein L,D-transpeptidase YcbB/YkuD